MRHQSRVRLFGKLKAYSTQGELFVSTLETMSTAEFRELVAQEIQKTHPEFPGAQELQSSAIANDSRILFEGEAIGDAREFSLLPPVCGG
ncbi:MAG: MoaD/ThiS family protein [Deltaproteobacteria bacterium]|jgi:molybdopterin converting factor small subunit